MKSNSVIYFCFKSPIFVSCVWNLDCDRVDIIDATRVVTSVRTIKSILFLSIFISLPSFAETTPNSTENLVTLKDVRISMQRMLKSTDGAYFLDLYAGIWNPHGTLSNLQEQTRTMFKGSQKGDLISLQSTDQAEANPYTLTGNLNANSGQFKAELSDLKNPNTKRAVTFEPAFKAVDKPLLVFKFYGLEGADQPYGRTLKRVDVINKNNGQVIQKLEGFNAFGNSIGFLDVNFDGFYDVVLSDTSEARKIEDKRFIYWMYNPQLKAFQRSPQLEKIVGFPTLKGESQKIDFGVGGQYRVDQGLLYPLNDE